MKKIITSIVTMAMVLTFLVVTPSEVQASEDKGTVGDYVDGSYLTDDTESTVTVYPRVRGVYLLTGSGSIAQVGTGLVGIGASTVANMSVSVVKVTAQLQRYVNGSWSNVNSWESKLYNTDYVKVSATTSVTRGYYYRVLSNHWAYTDWTQGVTNGIWIA